MDYPLSRPHGRRFGPWWSALLTTAITLCALCAVSAHAQALRVAAFSLVPAQGWQRADSTAEAEHGAFLLHATREPALQVVVPRAAPALKVDEADYRANLRRQWQVRHGAQVRIDELDIAGLSWLMLRRRAQDGAATVFQLSRVHAGRAYTVLVFAPSGARELPEAARDLLGHVRFVDTDPLWRLVRWVWARPPGDALHALLAAESDVDLASTVVTGYGLKHQEDTARWFAEGFDWVEEGGRATRRYWHHGGQLQVTPPEAMHAAAVWQVRLAVDVGGAPVVAGLRLWPSCAPGRQLERALERLEQGAADPLRRLLAGGGARCGGRIERGPDASLSVQAGQSDARRLVLTGPVQPVDGSQVRHWLVEVFLDAQAEQPGNALLGAVRGVYVYQADSN